MSVERRNTPIEHLKQGMGAGCGGALVGAVSYLAESRPWQKGSSASWGGFRTAVTAGTKRALTSAFKIDPK